ncbi:MAG TPA: hypothetical protein VK448_08880 [Dissulfurispiraceae bacterium]|nr:hypothetical protein [Dissulfurispiraceae bacterium]
MADKLKATEEQLAYALLLDKGMKLGLLMLIITFSIYLTGFLTPHVPVDDLPKYWSMPVHKYLESANIHPGWAWLYMLDKGDFLNFTGIAFLAAVTLICFARIVPILFRNKDSVYGIIAILELLVLALAASGLLKTGGH